MRITLCRYNLEDIVSGVDQQIVTAATHLRRAGHAVRVLQLRPCGPHNPYYLSLCRENIPVEHVQGGVAHRVARAAIRVAVPRGQPAWQEQQAIAWAARYHFARFRPAVAHVFDCWETIDLIRAAHAARVPVLYHDVRAPRDTPPAVSLHQQWHDPLVAHWYDRLAEVLPLCAAVAVLSPRLVPLFRERLGYQGPVVVLPLFVEVPERPPVRPPARGFTIGFAAFLWHLKGVAVLLEAFAKLRQHLPDARLRIAGSGLDEAELRAQSHALGLDGCCAFIGVYTGTQARTAFLGGLDVLTLPSYSEGTPNCLIEAMGQGLPVVATHVGGVPDVVAEEAGLLVPPGDANALVEALLRLGRDSALQAKMGTAGRERYEKYFSPDAVLPLQLQVYRALSGRRAGPTRAALQPDVPAHPWASAQE